MTFGALEILLVLFVVLLIVGPRRIANLGRSLGRGIRDFKLEFGNDRKNEELPEEEHEDRPAKKD
jgi:sec-independent protein translocase protein TatA